MKAHNKVIPIDKKGGSQTMQAPLPEPLTPPDVDLRNFRFMPFDVSRFRDSKFSAAVDPAAGFFAIQLWAAAWHQVPAGSLPSDESELRMLAGCGRDTKLWESVRDGAMYKWVLCSDGRYYHPAIAEFVSEAYDKLLINRENGKKGGRPAKAKDDTEKTDRLATANQTLTDRKPREEKRREVKRSESSSSSADASPSAAIVPASPAAAAVSPLSVDDLQENTPALIELAKLHSINRIPERLEYFKQKCRTKGYKPDNPLETFIQSCLEDWAKLNEKAGLQSVGSGQKVTNSATEAYWEQARLSAERAKALIFGNKQGDVE